MFQRFTQKTTKTSFFPAIMAFAIFLGLGFLNPIDLNAAGCEDLYISEYVEGSSNNKAIEIYNPTNYSVTLTSTYTLRIYSNGQTTFSTITLTGSIAPFGTFVVANTNAVAALKNLAQQTSGSLGFNGNDVVALVKSGTIIDVFGQIGNDPGVTGWGGVTTDRTLQRKVGINAGDADGSNVFVPSSEWNVLAIDTYTGIGSHTTNVPVVTGSTVTQPALCGGLGMIVVAATGTDAFEYSLTPSIEPWQSSETFADLPGRKYRPAVRLVAEPTCVFLTYQNPITINKAPVLEVSLAPVHPTCSNHSNGRITPTVTGSIGAVTYAWSNSTSNKTATALAPGMYTVTATDSRGCIAEETTTITAPDEVAVSIDVTGAGPYTVTVSATGGAGGYTYNMTGTTDFVAGNEFTVDAGIYSFRVKDANGCLGILRQVIPVVSPRPNGSATQYSQSFAAASLRVFPNPVQENINIAWSGDNDVTGEITLTNSFGQLVVRNQVALESAQQATISTVDMPNGIYFLNYKTATGESFTQRVVVTK